MNNKLIKQRAVGVGLASKGREQYCKVTAEVGKVKFDGQATGAAIKVR